jgi:uncharacterized protein DUF262/uncharacterized protein DUF1524
MEKLDGKSPIGALLAREFFFRIPEYQRPFSWDTDHFEDLVDDLINANRGQEYFLGTIVLHHRKAEGYYDVVDGQQRLTSVMILLACLRDLVAGDKFKTGLQDKILQQENVVDGIPERVRLEVRDRQLFSEIVVTDGGTNVDRSAMTLPEPELRYVNATNVFRSRLSTLGQTELQQLITFLNQKCVVISLATSEFADAFRLFTIVNDRGKQLRRIDILKALNIAPDVILKDTVRNRIAQQWEEVEKELGESTFENVFHLVRLLLLKDKPQGDLLKEFEERVIAKKMVAKGEPFFNLLFDYAKLYSSIFLDRDIVPEANPDHNRYRALIHIMNTEFSASEWRACLLYFAKKFQKDKFYEFCLLIEKVYLAQWVKGVRKDERYGDYSKILVMIESSKKVDEVLGGVAFDKEAIVDATQNKDLYSASYGKYFLLRLELVTAEHDAIREFNARSVEHVLPQQPDTNGYWADHHDLAKIKDYVNTIGNLVLLSKSKNSSASNFDFAKKKAKYLHDRVSDYPRSVKILEYKEWKKQDIDQRTADAKDLILKNP